MNVGDFNHSIFMRHTFIHPFLSTTSRGLFNGVRYGCKGYRGDRHLRIYLLSILRVEPPGCVEPLSSDEPLDSEESPGHETVWYIRVNREHQVDSRIKKTFHDVNSIYSGITLKLSDGSIQLARVLAIVYIEWDKKSKKGGKNVSVS